MSRLGLAGCLLFAWFATVVEAAPSGSKEPVRLWPLYRSIETDEGKEVEVLFPLLYIRKSADEDLYWFLYINSYKRDRKSDSRTWDFLWPIIHWNRAASGDFKARVLPLFLGRQNDRFHAVLFPAFWHTREKDGYLLVVGPVISSRNKTSRCLAFLPVVFWRSNPEEKSSTFVLPPFFRSRYWDNGDHHLLGFGPVVWKRVNGKTDRLLVLPLYFQTPEKRVLFPVYWSTKDLYLVIPFYGKGKSGKWSWETILPPAWLKFSDGEYTQKSVLWPLTASGTGPDRERLTIHPFYDYWRRGDRWQRSHLLGLGARGRGPNWALDRVLPFFGLERTSDTRDLVILWPFWRDKQAKEFRERRILCPIPMETTINAPAESWQVLNLIWWERNTAEGRWDLRTPRQTAYTFQIAHGFYPLYAAARVQVKERDRLQDRDGLSTITSEASTELQHDLRLLDPFAPFDAPYPDNLLPPLFHAHTETDGECKFTMPLSLFRWEKSAIRLPDGSRRLGGRIRTIGTPLVFSHTDSSSPSHQDHQLHVLSLFWDSHSITKGEQEHSQGLWPIYTFKRTAAGGLNLTALDPLWIWGMATGEEEHVSVLMRIFDYRRQAGGESRFRLLWRAYMRDYRPSPQGDRVSGEAFPFLYWERSPERRRFGFLWRFFSYEKDASGGRHWRLFFVPIG